MKPPIQHVYAEISVSAILAALAGLALLYSGKNVEIFLFINQWGDVSHPGFWAHMTLLGDALIAAVLVLPFIRLRPNLIWTVILAALICTVFVQVLKPAIQLDRPAAVLDGEEFRVIGRVLRHRAFPSGHSATALTLAGALALTSSKRWVRLVLIVIGWSVALSRVVVGAHWPLDVLGGGLLGLLSAWIGYMIACRWDWGEKRIPSMIWGGLLLASALVLLVGYDTHYPGTMLFQRGIALFCLVWGGIEYGRLTISSPHE